MNAYAWYDKIDEASSDITQGDIIFGCSAYRPMDASKADEGVEKIVFTGIVMTQACDIEQEKVGMIIVCPIKTIAEISKELGWSKSKAKSQLGDMVKNQMPAYFLLDKYIEGMDLLMEYMVVDFRNIFSISVDSLREIARGNGERLRLRSPYKESLAQAFGRFFMRVGLPTSIDKHLLNDFIDGLEW